MIGLRVERHLPAQPERVWRALTDPRALAAWFWPSHFGTVVTADPRPGGAWRITAAATGLAVAGEYTVVEPPHRLAFTWRWDGEDTETLVTVELSPALAGTALVLTHERFAAEADRDDHAIGWSDCLDRLPGYLDDEHDDRPDPAADRPGDATPARPQNRPPTSAVDAGEA